MRILNIIGESCTPEALSTLRKLGEVVSRTVTHSELVNIIGEYDVLFMGLYPDVDSEVLAGAKKLKVIASASTNLYHIDTDIAKERGIEVLTLQGETDFLYTITGTSEMAVGLMLDLLRKTPWAFDDVKNYRWRRESFRGHNLYGKTLGIVGLGRLGSWMARYGNAFNMEVLAHSPHSAPTRFAEFGCRSVELSELLERSDVVSIHAELNDDTRHMFDAAALSQMKDTAYLINTAVEGIVDEAALLLALERGGIAGYGTDVLEGETRFEEAFHSHPLVEYAKSHDNLIIVPHLGGMTAESREATDIFMARKVANHVRTL